MSDSYCPTCGRSPDDRAGCQECGAPCSDECHGVLPETRVAELEAALREIATFTCANDDTGDEADCPTLEADGGITRADYCAVCQARAALKGTSR